MSEIAQQVLQNATPFAKNGVVGRSARLALIRGLAPVGRRMAHQVAVTQIGERGLDDALPSRAIGEHADLTVCGLGVDRQLRDADKLHR